MVQQFKVPWAAWYGDMDQILEFPDSWDVQIFKMNDAEEISREEIEKAINNPIGTRTIQEIARNKKNAVILVEDISRPTRLGTILNVVIRCLNEVGIPDQDITLIFALGAHRPMNRFDILKKVGKDILNRVNIENHHPYENLLYLGDSKKGTPIYINKTYYKSDVKITIGTVLPHPLAGFGGGAKIVLPGVAGIQTLEANHKAGIRGIGIGIGIITELRKDIEDVCKRVGLDYTINIVSTMRRGIAGIFAGHFIDAHRKAIELAKEVYKTELPNDLNLDIGFFNLYPEDTEFSQAFKGFNFYLSSKNFINRKGAVILMTSASEGRGFHSLQGETGAKLYQNWGESVVFNAILKKKNFGVFSPNISRADLLHFYSDRTIFCKEFKEMIIELEKLYGNSPKAGIFPCSNQMP